MPYTQFPTIPNNLPPDAVKWGKTVEAVFNELIARIQVLESRR